MENRNFSDWFRRVFPGEAIDWPYPAVTDGGDTYIFLLASELEAAREYSRTHPLPRPIVPVVGIDTDGFTPPTGRWIRIGPDGCWSMDGGERLNWWGIDFEHFNETVAACGQIKKHL